MRRRCWCPIIHHRAIWLLLLLLLRLRLIYGTLPRFVMFLIGNEKAK